MSSRPRYATVVLDVDSTVAGIEGIDWLAGLRAPDVAAHSEVLTRQAMEGAVALEKVYGDRMRLIAPTAEEIDRLGGAYVAAIAPGCIDAVRQLRAAGVHVVLISGGLWEAIRAVSDALGLPRRDVHAVSVRFAKDGAYAGFDQASPLAMRGGKRLVVEGLALKHPILAIGDGATDIDMKPVVDTFAAFTGFVRREAVVQAAAVEFRSFVEVVEFVLVESPLSS